MAEEVLPCIVCGCWLRNVAPGMRNQPSGGMVR